MRVDKHGPRLSVDTEIQLAEAAANYYDDPYGFVMFAFPWGQPTLPDGSYNPLHDREGPEDWQRDLLQALGRHIQLNLDFRLFDLNYWVWRSAIASGHGVGKSAIVAWLILFFMMTRRDCRGVVTANTAAQLETKTWPELARWHDIFIAKHWFTWTATSYYFRLYPEDKQKTYMFNAATVSEHNTDAFQGLHNRTSAVVVIFDEAGGIFAKLWEVVQGAFSDGEPFFFAFGNPTDPDAEFANCFDKNAALYYTREIDSRSVTFTNKIALQNIIRIYGEDSDEARVRVYGKFPRQAYDGFFHSDAIRAACERQHKPDYDAGIIMAVDVARYGRDSTVIRVRQGRNARLRPPVILRGKNNVEVARIVAREADIIKPDAIVIESTGPGAGVIDILKDRGYRVTEIHPGAMSSEPAKFYRLRDELYDHAREWLDTGCLPQEPALIEQMSKIKYSLDRHNTATKIESKDDFMDRTKLTSPDEMDSLILTFGVKVARRDRNKDRGREVQNTYKTEYDPFEHA